MAPNEPLSTHVLGAEAQEAAAERVAGGCGAEELSDRGAEGLSGQRIQSWRRVVICGLGVVLVASLALAASQSEASTVQLLSKDKALGFSYSTTARGAVTGAEGLKDPYPEDHTQDVDGRRAQLAPAAERVKELWHKTVGDLFHDQMSRSMSLSGYPARQNEGLMASEPEGHEGEGDNLNPYTPFRAEKMLHGKLLPSAEEAEGRWTSQIQQMKQDQLSKNQYVMNNVVLLHSGQMPTPEKVKKAAKARLAQLAERTVSTEQLNPSAPPAPQAPAGKGSAASEAKEQAEVPKHSALATAPAPAAAPAPAPAAPAPQVKTGSSATESRQALLSFFSDLKHRDEEKTAIHNAKYKALPPPPSPLPQPPTNMLNMKQLAAVQKELKWLKTRVTQLQETLSSEMKDKEAKKPKLQTLKPPPTHRFAHLPPPLGCPIWPAQGEVLPAHCPRQVPALSQAPHLCPDGSLKYNCES